MMKATSTWHKFKIVSQRLVWVALPLGFLMIMEFKARKQFTEQVSWYKGEEKTVISQHIDYIFIGSSRVAAAIDNTAFTEVVSQVLGRQVITLNMGAGYSTMAEHFMGLRNLWLTAPQNLKGTTVFISMETGLPYNDTWETKWNHPDRPEMISPLLNFSDIIYAWQISKLPLSEKLDLSSQYLQRFSVAFSRRNIIREQFLLEANQTFVNILRSTGIVTKNRENKPKTLTYNLTTAGGIRNDVDGVTQSRNLAFKLANLDLQNQKPIRNWEQSILADLVNMVTKNGGKVIFFATPHSSVQARPMQTDLRKADQKFFAEKATKDWCTVILQPNFTVKDVDIPDLWHISRALAPQFTTALANTYIRYLHNSTATPSTVILPNCLNKSK